ncbi:MAG TPA: hypothetical protein VK842_00935 [bacterium]|jgi:hypothetical protein|nr:hypothetical protein [bacterium]
MILKLIAAVCLLAPPSAALAGPSLPEGGCSILAAGVLVKDADIMVSKKPDHVHVLVDLFPYHDAMKTAGPKDLDKLAFNAASGCAALKYPDAKSIKVDLAEFSERDSYGAPVWSSVKVLGKYQFAKKKGAWKPVNTKE